jgi:phage regulator Rha-like protein
MNFSNLIYEIRGLRVMLDSDLADLYEVETKQLKRAVKRNIERFPEPDFMFQLINQDVTRLRCQIGTSNKDRGGTRYMPYAFTEQGVAMLSSVLNSKKAIQMNIQIMRAFVQMRQTIFSPKEGLEKVLEIEKIQKIHGHLLNEQNDNIAIIFEAIRQLEELPEEEQKKIGFMR